MKFNCTNMGSKKDMKFHSVRSCDECMYLAESGTIDLNLQISYPSLREEH